MCPYVSTVLQCVHFGEDSFPHLWSRDREGNIFAMASCSHLAWLSGVSLQESHFSITSWQPCGLERKDCAKGCPVVSTWYRSCPTCMCACRSCMCGGISLATLGLIVSVLSLGANQEESSAAATHEFLLKSCLSVSRVETGTPGGGGCVLVRHVS